MNPKINIWNTGSDKDSGNVFGNLANISKCIPPIIETIHDQTNLRFPEWFVKDTNKMTVTEKKPEIPATNAASV